MSQEFEFAIAFDDFDASILPEDARTPGSERFVTALRELVEREYAEHGGWATIVVDEGARLLTVKWGDRAGGYDPLESAVTRLGRGQYEAAIRTLELLRFRHPDDVAVLYNLGMALSDRGQLPTAIGHLRRAAGLAPRDGNVRVALGVALARSGQATEAVRQLREAVAVAPTNPWAHRNLAGCLMRAGDTTESETHFRTAVELNPRDAAARVGLGKCLVAGDRPGEADEQFVAAIDLDEHGPAGEAAKEERTRLARTNFRVPMPGAERPDAVMYCLGAIERFEKMSSEEVQAVGFEIAVLGMSGINPNDAGKRYTLKALPGEFSGLQLLCTMYVAFKLIAPDRDTGFDVGREYRAAAAMYEARKGKRGT
jgi:tetratricopeptide (TPR) repeat protein